MIERFVVEGSLLLLPSRLTRTQAAVVGADATTASAGTTNEQKALKQAKFNIINLSCEV